VRVSNDFCETRRRIFYHEKLGRPSLPWNVLPVDADRFLRFLWLANCRFAYIPWYLLFLRAQKLDSGAV